MILRINKTKNLTSWSNLGWNYLLQYNFEEFPNEVACQVVFYWFATMFLHQRPVHVKIRLDHHQKVLLKILLFFESMDWVEFSNERLQDGALCQSWVKILDLVTIRKRALNLEQSEQGLDQWCKESGKLVWLASSGWPHHYLAISFLIFSNLKKNGFWTSYFCFRWLLLSSSIYLNTSKGTKFDVMNFLIRRTFRNHFVLFTIAYASAKAKNPPIFDPHPEK